MKTKTLTGDVLQVLKRQPSNSFDGCLSDPPYGLGFMGKKWDSVLPREEVWAEVLRVLKPGAPLMAFGGTRTHHRLMCAIEDAGFAISDTLCWLHGQGFPKGHAQLKPAWEPIILAWKKGPRVLAIDAGRIGPAGGTADAGGTAGLSVNSYGHGLNNRRSVPVAGLGRWPANVILDEEAGAALDAATGTLKSGGKANATYSNVNKSEFLGYGTQTSGLYGSSGGASRFFYCAKASRKERGEGNTHPTVKPIKLIEYLAKLILPPERDTPRRLLVPFSGSGSEMLGARKAGWDRITGIEISPEYAAIAATRLKAA